VEKKEDGGREGRIKLSGIRSEKRTEESLELAKDGSSMRRQEFREGESPNK